MSDTVCPDEHGFNRALRDSCRTWSTYLDIDDSELPFDCVKLEEILTHAPHFLAYGITPTDESLSFNCVERGTPPGPYALYVKGSSEWKTSKGSCDLSHKVMEHRLLLATQTILQVELSDETAFTNWPNVRELDGYDQGNYISVLLLAWVYILSVKWAESLQRSPGHDCFIKYVSSANVSLAWSLKDTFRIGVDIDEQGMRWWNAILAGDKGWQVGVHYNAKTYVSPWSVSIVGERSEERIPDTRFPPLSSDMALGYLAAFCTHHRLYGQCSAALAAALYIPLLSDRRTRLPKPRLAPFHVSQLQSITTPRPAAETKFSSTELVFIYGTLLPQFMSLSTNTWGMRSLLCGTFFNPEIQCNLVSAWLNPAFAVISPLLNETNMDRLAAVLSRRQPRLAPLWLGAIVTGTAKSVIRDLKNGLSALDLHAAAWTGSVQSFISLPFGTHDGQLIRREDECRLLFITAAADDQHSRVPLSPWKPFGCSRICDTELEVQKHVQCNCHCFEYEAWHWRLSDGRELRDYGIGQMISDEGALLDDNKSSLVPYKFRDTDLASQSLSEAATRGIYGWLRSNGYPACEKSLYQHPWIDIKSSDDEDAHESDTDISAKTENIHIWLDRHNQSLNQSD